MRLAVQVDDPICVYVLINHVHGAVVLENLKRRWQIRGARHSGLEASFFRIGSRPIREILPVLSSRFGPIRDLAVRRIDNHVRAIEVGVCIVLSHPDATEVSCRALGPAAVARGSEHNRQNKTAPKVYSAWRLGNVSHCALPRYSRIQSTRCPRADAAAEYAGSRAANIWWDHRHAPRKRSCRLTSL